MAQLEVSPYTRKLLLGYLIDILSPFAALYACSALHLSILLSLGIGAGIAIVSMLINTLRIRRIDTVGILVLIELAASIAALYWWHSPRMLLLRPSLYTGIAGIWLMMSAFTSRPLTLEGSKPFATHGSALRQAAWERAWITLPRFRLAHRLLTFGLGIASLADSLLRVVVVYTLPFERAAWLSSLPHCAAILVLLGCGASFGRWAAPMVDVVEREMQHPLPPT